MRKLLNVLCLALLFTILPKITQATTITVDGDLSDWTDVPSLYSGTEKDLGTDYYWVNNAWTTVDPETATWKVNQEKMLNILDFKMANNDSQLCFMMQAVYPFMGVLYEATGEYYPYGYPTEYNQYGMPIAFVPGAPADFDHSMVLSFDLNQDAVFDYYGVMHFTWSAGGSGQDAMSVSRTIYQDNGDGAFDDLTDTVLEVSGDPAEEISADDALLNGGGIPQTIEGCQDFGASGYTFLDLGETVDIRLETHSQIMDHSDTVAYTLNSEATELLLTGSQDAWIVGTGKNGNNMGKGKVYLYDTATGAELLNFTAYDRKCGAKVASGDVDADGAQEIITLPWKQYKNPEVKVFDVAGNLEANDRIFAHKLKGAHKFGFAVGDVNADGTDEMVFARAKNDALIIYVTKLTASGNLKLLDSYTTDLPGYTKDAWVSVGNVDQDDAAEEIITSAFKGVGRLDLWKYTDDNINYISSYVTEVTKGMHIAAKSGAVYSYTKAKGALVMEYVYVNDTLAFTPQTTEIDTYGSLGDLAYSSVNEQFAASNWSKKKVRTYDADGNIVLTLDVNSKGAFLDYLDQ